jgi:hypothetical protein
MSTQTRSTPLPVPTPEYDARAEAINRTIELTLDQIENDVVLAKTQGDKEGSLAMRRFQFLLMGAS